MCEIVSDHMRKMVKSLWWSSANILLPFWHLLIHFPQIIAVPTVWELFYGETMRWIMLVASAYGMVFFLVFFFHIFPEDNLCPHAWETAKDAKNPLWPSHFFLYVMSLLVFIWPFTYALTYGNNKYYKCSWFMPSCKTHTMRCKLLWHKTTGIIFTGNQNHCHLASCWQFSNLNEFWLRAVLINLRKD